MRILIATAVDMERNAVLQGIQNTKGIDVVTVGVGPVAAAVNTAMTLATTPYNLVINLGIAGGFTSHAKVGSLVVANEVICADLGVETLNGFLALDQVDFGATSIKTDPNLVITLSKALAGAGLPTHTGPILTVSTTTGTIETATQLTSRIPEAAAEAMEGFGVASAAQAYTIPFIEIRAISNSVGPRDKAKWHINEALTTLTKASSVLEKEVLDANRLLTLS